METPALLLEITHCHVRSSISLPGCGYYNYYKSVHILKYIQKLNMYFIYTFLIYSNIIQLNINIYQQTGPLSQTAA